MKKLTCMLLFLFTCVNCWATDVDIMRRFQPIGENIIFPDCEIVPFLGEPFYLKNHKDKVIILTLWDRNISGNLDQLVFIHDLARHFQHDIEEKRIIFINAYRQSVTTVLKGWEKFKTEKELITAIKSFPNLKKIEFSNATYGKINGDNFLNFVYGLIRTNNFPLLLVFDHKMKCLGCFRGLIDVKNKGFAQYLQKVMDGTLNKRKNRKSLWFKIKRFFGFKN